MVLCYVVGIAMNFIPYILYNSLDVACIQQTNAHNINENILNGKLCGLLSMNHRKLFEMHMETDGAQFGMVFVSSVARFSIDCYLVFCKWLEIISFSLSTQPISQWTWTIGRLECNCDNIEPWTQSVGMDAICLQTYTLYSFTSNGAITLHFFSVFFFSISYQIK